MYMSKRRVNCWKKCRDKLVIRTSSVIVHGQQTMGSLLFTACCQSKQAPSVTSLLCWSGWEVLEASTCADLWLCNVIPQQHQQQYVWIINPSFYSFFSTTLDSEEGSQCLPTALDPLLSNSSSFFQIYIPAANHSEASLQSYIITLTHSWMKED